MALQWFSSLFLHLHVCQLWQSPQNLWLSGTCCLSYQDYETSDVKVFPRAWGMLVMKWVFPVSQQHPANSGLWIPRDGGCAWQVICFVCCDMQGHSQAVPVIAQNPWQSPSSLGLSRKELWQYFTTVISWYYLWVTDVFLSFLRFYFLFVWRLATWNIALVSKISLWFLLSFLTLVIYFGCTSTLRTSAFSSDQVHSHSSCFSNSLNMYNDAVGLVSVISLNIFQDFLHP